MNVRRTVFSQLMDFVPRREFRRIVKHYRGSHMVGHPFTGVTDCMRNTRKFVGACSVTPVVKHLCSKRCYI
jgi:hypothetical protein